MSNKIQRNYPCPCNSGKKFKRCCEVEMLRERQVQRVQELERMHSVQAQHEPERGGIQSDEGRISRELAAVISLIQKTWPMAVDYNVRHDDQVDILDAMDVNIATISSEELTKFWNEAETASSEAVSCEKGSAVSYGKDYIV